MLGRMKVLACNQRKWIFASEEILLPFKKMYLLCCNIISENSNTRVKKGVIQIMNISQKLWIALQTRLPFN